MYFSTHCKLIFYLHYSRSHHPANTTDYLLSPNVVFILPNLSVAFNTADYSTFVKTVSSTGFHYITYSWFPSYSLWLGLFIVFCRLCCSFSCPINLPQGFVLRTPLFNCHLYPSDSQIYIFSLDHIPEFHLCIAQFLDYLHLALHLKVK